MTPSNTVQVWSTRCGFRVGAEAAHRRHRADSPPRDQPTYQWRRTQTCWWGIRTNLVRGDSSCLLWEEFVKICCIRALAFDSSDQSFWISVTWTSNYKANTVNKIIVRSQESNSNHQRRNVSSWPIVHQVLYSTLALHSALEPGEQWCPPQRAAPPGRLLEEQCPSRHYPTAEGCGGV